MGAGILYVRKDKINKLYPLFGESGYNDDDIRKLNHTGTHPVATDIAINHAIDYHQTIGIKRKRRSPSFFTELLDRPYKRFKEYLPQHTR